MIFHQLVYLHNYLRKRFLKHYDIFGSRGNEKVWAGILNNVHHHPISTAGNEKFPQTFLLIFQKWDHSY